jgi:glutathionylspermidine synthase
MTKSETLEASGTANMNCENLLCSEQEEAAQSSSVSCQCPLRAGALLEGSLYSMLRRRMVLEGCKWDPQVGDVNTLARFPLFMRDTEWRVVASASEQLAAETVAAESEIVGQPRLLRKLGLPRALCHALTGNAALTPAAVRVMRFDFHWTTDGWQLSEVNSDVPGGFTEASYFTRLMTEHYPGARPAGDPVAEWAEALTQTAGEDGVVGLLAATGYMEDQQIMAFLAARLRERGLRAHLANPTQLIWRDGWAHLDAAWFCGRLDAVVRFYQGEWLARLPRRFGWQNFFRAGQTPVGNPGVGVIAESKRFPLVWDELTTRLIAWRRFLPESRDPRDAPWRTDDGWLVKSAMSNTGDDVCIRPLLNEHEWRRACWEVRLSPGRWVAQRRFESVPIETPDGWRHACIGVYTINGRAAGVYTRLAPRPWIDFAAVDAALLVTEASKPMQRDEYFHGSKH